MAEHYTVKYIFFFKVFFLNKKKKEGNIPITKKEDILEFKKNYVFFSSIISPPYPFFFYIIH